MATVQEHYSNLLAPIYAWTVGGLDAAFEQGEAEVASFFKPGTSRCIVVDLGAGFGMHAIPLARRGCSVIAVDASAYLLSILREHSDDLPIRTVEADLLSFSDYLTGAADLFVCMGDTLTHLADHESVRQLFSKVAASILPGGAFVLTFRDYTNPPEGLSRFIPVRNDANRVLTCFLETTPSHVLVHDILYEREERDWRMTVSSYPKLRVDPDWVVRALEALRFRVERSAGLRGMVRIVATAANER